MIEPVENMYKGGFFKNRKSLSWRAPIVVEALINTFRLDPKKDTVIDVGCAIGDYVAKLEELGFGVYGIEGSKAAEEFFVSDKIAVWDLRKPLILGGHFLAPYSLAFSLEVAEHISPFHADTYIDNLCSLSDTILISAATPGQKGHGHVNCVPKDYWMKKFRERGYINMRGLENRWQSELGAYRTKKELSSYIKNVIVFKRQNPREKSIQPLKIVSPGEESNE